MNDLDKWNECLGRIVINFGLIEKVTYECIEEFFTENLKTALQKNNFNKRIEISKAAIKDAYSVGEEDEDKLFSFFDQAVRLSEIRNLYIHNTVFSDFYTDEHNEKLEVETSLHLAKTGETKSLQEVQEFSEELAALSRDMFMFWRELRYNQILPDNN